MVRKRKLHSQNDRTAFWLTQSPAQRVAALEVIRGTTNDSIYVQRPFPKILRIVRRKTKSLPEKKLS